MCEKLNKGRFIVIELFKHNEEAFAFTLSMLNAGGKAAAIHPTGTGKSFIGFKLYMEIKMYRSI